MARVRLTRSASIGNRSLPSIAEYQGAGSSTAANMWAAAILTALRAPVNKNNLYSLIGWFQLEGGGGQNNPLNTTQPSPGETSTVPGTPGVGNYGSPAAGVRATAQTLQGYPAIVRSLRSGQGIPATPQISGELSRWSGGGYSSISPQSAYRPSPSSGYSLTRPGGATTANVYDVFAAYQSSDGGSGTSPYATIKGVRSPADIRRSVRWSWDRASQQYADMQAQADAPVGFFGGVAHAAGAFSRFIEYLPFYMLRGVEIIGGATLMYMGVRGIATNRSYTPKPSVLSSGVRAGLSLIPGVEAARYLRAGRKEGNAEHYRLQGRREERARLGGNQPVSSSSTTTAKRASSAAIARQQREGKARKDAARAAKNKSS